MVLLSDVGSIPTSSTILTTSKILEIKKRQKCLFLCYYFGMSTEQSFVDYIVEQASLAGDIYARKMFGEYALYCDNKVVGLITDNTLYIKITDEGKAFVGDNYQEGNAYNGAKTSMVIIEDLVSDRVWFTELIRITTVNLPFSKKK